MERLQRLHPRNGAIFALLSATILLFSMLAGGVSAQSTGSLRGYVYEGGTRRPLAGVSVSIVDTGLGGLTDADGFYQIAGISAGSYTVVASGFGFVADTATVSIGAGAPTQRDFELGQGAFELEGLTVTGVRGGQIRSINDKRQALSVVDVLSADEIGKLPDLNVAESAQRLPGITIRTDRGEGRFISIRGTAPNRNNVTFNGQVLASAAGTRATALDLVPAEMVSSIEVSKAVLPDQDANALGGSVNIETLTAFDREGSFLTGFLYGLAHQETTDWGDAQTPYRANVTGGGRFGADQNFGIVVSGSASRRAFNTAIASPAAWVDVDGVAAPEEFEREVEDNDRTRYALNANLDFRPSESTNLYSRIQYSAFQDVFTNTEIQFGGDPVPTSETAGRLEGIEGQLDIPTTDIDENLTAITLGLDQQFGTNVTLEVAGTFSRGERIRRTFQPEWGEDQDFALSYDLTGDFESLTFDSFAAASDPANYIYTEMDIEFEDLVEDTYQFGADLRWDFRSSDAVGFLKAGGAFRLRDKNIDRNENPWAAGDTPLALTQFRINSPGRIQGGAQVPITGDVFDFLDFFNQNTNNGTVNTDLFSLDPVESAEEEVEVDAFVTEDVYAGYLMGNYQVGKWTATGGVRVEATTTTSERFRFVNDDSFDNAQISLQEAENDYVDILPSLHVVYRAADNFQIRGAWSNTIGRPDYDELAAFQDIEFEEINPGVFEGAIEEGNPDLEPLRAMNFDVTLEYYPGPGSIFSVGAFHKRIQDPIYNFVTTQRDIFGRDFTIDVQEIPNFDDRFFEQVEFQQQRNADEGTISGLEFSYAQVFDFLPGFLRGLGLSSNLAAMTSDVTVPGREDEDLPFFDQSDLVVNFVPYYQLGPLELRSAFNYQSEFLSGVAEDAFEDEYGDERFTIDLTGRYELLEGRLQLNAYVRNLTNEAEREFQGIRSRRIFHALQGRTFEFGATIIP
jgi:TonB-dependent receptor